MAAFLISLGAYAHGNAPGSASSQNTTNVNRDQIKQAQTKLDQEGYHAGKPDGVFGSKTAQAVRKFQRDHGENVTGKLDQPTLAALGIQSTGQAGQTGQQEEQSRDQMETRDQQAGTTGSTFDSQSSDTETSETGSPGTSGNSDTSQSGTSESDTENTDTGSS